MSANNSPEQTTPAPARRQQFRARISRLHQSRQQGMLGVPEIIGLCAGGVMLLAVIFSYFYFMTPARARLKTLQGERVKLQDRIREAQKGVDPNASPQVTIAEINESLDTFERNTLAQRNVGRMALYSQLNELMRRNNLRNTAGPSYSTLDPLGTVPAAGASVASKAGNEKWQSLYPGIGITVTVEGSYANLRHFLRDIEAGNQFIVINAVELEGVTASGEAAGAAMVSLQLNMATYFQRDGFEASLPPTTETR